MRDIEKMVRRLPWRRDNSRPHGYQPGPFALIYSVLLAAGLAASSAVYYGLVHHVPGMAANRADTAKTALLVIGGSGALAGLYVAYRKQRTDEANHLRDQDKLFTERYTTAVAQLGNSAAAVRLGGVYALARIADDSERDRPTCLEVLCAYLRMPYDLDATQAGKAEQQVRTTAQNVVTARLHTSHPGFWPGAVIDLNGAHLHGIRCDGITASEFDARGATFTGGVSSFEGATFTGWALFQGATFAGYALFGGATFDDLAVFDGATFNDGSAQFVGTTFGGLAMFDGATFGGDTQFNRATFTADARFEDAAFSGYATFDKAKFSAIPKFGGSRFQKDRPPVWPAGFPEPEGIVWDLAVSSAAGPSPDPKPPVDPPSGPINPPNPV